jgi:hypothetical protein
MAPGKPDATVVVMLGRESCAKHALSTSNNSNNISLARHSSLLGRLSSTFSRARRASSKATAVAPASPTPPAGKTDSTAPARTNDIAAWQDTDVQQRRRGLAHDPLEPCWASADIRSSLVTPPPPSAPHAAQLHAHPARTSSTVSATNSTVSNCHSSSTKRARMAAAFSRVTAHVQCAVSLLRLVRAGSSRARGSNRANSSGSTSSSTRTSICSDLLLQRFTCAQHQQPCTDAPAALLPTGAVQPGADTAMPCKQAPLAAAAAAAPIPTPRSRGGWAGGQQRSPQLQACSSYCHLAGWQQAAFLHAPHAQQFEARRQTKATLAAAAAAPCSHPLVVGFAVV